MLLALLRYSYCIMVQRHLKLEQCARILSQSLAPKSSLPMLLHTSRPTTNASKIDKSRVPVLSEKDLEERFVLGSGPGGQHVNKTASACQLKHLPTGLIVKCHEDRNLHKNRSMARKLMISKLDDYYNGDMSVSAQKKRLENTKNIKSKQKAAKRQEMKRAWKEREGIE